MKYLLILFLLFMVLCTKQVTEIPILHEPVDSLFVGATGDTINYLLVFPDRDEQKKFKVALDTLIQNYSYEIKKSDSKNQIFSIRLIPESQDKTSLADNIPFFEEEEEILESDLEIYDGQFLIDEKRPPSGGHIVLYTDNKVIDSNVRLLLGTFPFQTQKPVLSDTIGHYPIDQRDGPTDFFSVSRVSPLKIQLTCTSFLKDNKGNPITAFDIVQSWIMLVQKRPAEGLAIFTHVRGIKKFIRGEEAIIQGFSVTNEKTIILTLDKEDDYAVQRLHTPTLLPPSLKMGRFYVTSQEKNIVILEGNDHFPFNKSLIDTCTLVFGNDKNPLVSYSLNKYDMVVLYKKNDLQYARNSISENSKIIAYSTDRYFLSLGSNSRAIRHVLHGYINPTNIFNNTIRAEGSIITKIETDSIDEANLEMASSVESTFEETTIAHTVTILYNSDDPISLSIAEKIFSDLSRQNISCELKGKQHYAYEISLVDRIYDIAVGWVNNSVLANKTEAFRLATIWFDNEVNEYIRLSEFYELPLFTVHKYALCKKEIEFYRNKFSGIYWDIQ